MDYQLIRNKIAHGKEIVEQFKDQTPKPVLEVCYTMFDINEMLVDKLEELDNKISKNSRNSSRPPSKDETFDKNKSLRGKSGKKPGGQDGHSGSTLRKVENPDHVVEHRPKGQCRCGIELKNLNFKVQSTRQVFEVEIKKVVTEHQVLQGICNCGMEHCGNYPEGVNGNTQYGERARGIVGYLSKYQLIPSDRLEELMGDLFQLEMSEGTIDNIGYYAENGLIEFKEKFEEHVSEMKIGNVDETPTKVNGKTGFFHVLSNEAFSFLYFDSKRGMSAVDALGLLARFKGTLVHDCFSMYFNYGKDHSVCNAHLLRELTFIEEKYQHRWAHEAKNFLYDLNELKKLQILEGKFSLDKNDLDNLSLSFYEVLSRGRHECSRIITEVKSSGRKRGKQHPALNLMNRMLKLQNEILKFAYDFDVPFTNNQAERDLRMTKVQLKISGGFRSEKGARLFALFRSYIGTAKKHGQNILEAIKNLYNPNHNKTLDVFFKPAITLTC